MDKNLTLESFVDRLYEEKNFPPNLEKEIVDEIKKDILDRVEDRINVVIINNLSEEKLTEFNKLLDKNAPEEEVQKFCLESIPDLENLIASELILFKESYIV